MSLIEDGTTNPLPSSEVGMTTSLISLIEIWTKSTAPDRSELEERCLQFAKSALKHRQEHPTANTDPSSLALKLQAVEERDFIYVAGFIEEIGVQLFARGEERSILAGMCLISSAQTLRETRQ